METCTPIQFHIWEVSTETLPACNYEADGALSLCFLELYRMLYLKHLAEFLSIRILLQVLYTYEQAPHYNKRWLPILQCYTSTEKKYV